MEIERNPKDFCDAEYLRCLNTCFPGWGDGRHFVWAFRRQVGGPAPDLMVVRDAGTIIAGSAVSYRTIRFADGSSTLVGVMTGSWTLPAARGRGAFSYIIQESVAATASRGASLLLAFGPEQNPRFRRLREAGATLYPTRYLVSPSEPPRADRSAEYREHPGSAARTPHWFSAFQGARLGAHFHYPTLESWAGQHLERPGELALVETAGGAALVETHGEFDRVQALTSLEAPARLGLLEAVLARAQMAKRRLFLFESRPRRGESLTSRCGMVANPGFLTAMPADDEAAALLADRPLEWDIDSGDRM